MIKGLTKIIPLLLLERRGIIIKKKNQFLLGNIPSTHMI
jgi:hypothetical protein